MKLAKREKKVIKMMSCRKSKLYILSFLIFINNAIFNLPSRFKNFGEGSIPNKQVL